MIHFLRGETYPLPGRRSYPANQVEAWMVHRQAHWFLFDRMWLARYQGLTAHPHGVVPTSFPVFSRPVVNLAGDNAGGAILQFWHDMNFRAGHFWMPVLPGPASILDLLMDRGVVVACYLIERLDERNGVPIRYDGRQLVDPELNQAVGPYLPALHDLLPDHTGPLSLRRMGQVVTSIRFCLTDEFAPFWMPRLTGPGPGPAQPIPPATVIPIPALQTRGDLYTADLKALSELDVEVVAIRFEPGKTIRYQPANDLVYQLGFVGDRDAKKADAAAGLMVELLRPIKKGKG